MISNQGFLGIFVRFRCLIFSAASPQHCAGHKYEQFSVSHSSGQTSREGVRRIDSSLFLLSEVSSVLLAWWSIVRLTAFSVDWSLSLIQQCLGHVIVQSKSQLSGQGCKFDIVVF